MTSAIKNLIEKANNLLICPSCRGEGEVDYFCGHYTTTSCEMCAGNGIIKSLKKQKHQEVCIICRGKGGPGCCDNRGFQEWESYELFENAPKNSQIN
jgi:DnaJ-class molecular chaperone